jgi:hypothetical protein
MTPTLRVLIGTMFALSFLFATPIEAGQKMTTAVGNMSHEGKKAVIQNLRARTAPPQSPKGGSPANVNSSKR